MKRMVFMIGISTHMLTKLLCTCTSKNCLRLNIFFYTFPISLWLKMSRTFCVGAHSCEKCMTYVMNLIIFVLTILAIHIKHKHLVHDSKPWLLDAFHKIQTEKTLCWIKYNISVETCNKIKHKQHPLTYI